MNVTLFLCVQFPHAFSLSTQVQSPCSEGQGLLWCIMNRPNTFLHSWRKLNAFMDLGHCCFSKGIPSRWFLVCVCVSVGRCTCVWVPMHVCTHAYDSQRTNSGVLFWMSAYALFFERGSLSGMDLTDLVRLAMQMCIHICCICTHACMYVCIAHTHRGG